MDIVSKKKRSDMMSRIRSKNTGPEKYVRKELRKRGFQFTLHKKNLPGKPDIVLKKHRVVINVNGCFWHHHNCGKYNIPKSNRKFWLGKFKKNMERDELNTKKLRKLGWKVYKIWECKLKQNTNRILNKI